MRVFEVNSRKYMIEVKHYEKSSCNDDDSSYGYGYAGWMRQLQQ